MGIRGLLSFMKENRVFDPTTVHDVCLVIDGNNLLHRMYFDAYHLDLAHGGDYCRFAEECESFFTSLQRCKVKPYVVFDGILDLFKMDTVKERILEVIKMIGTMMETQGKVLKQVCPVLTTLVMTEVMNRLGVTYMRADDEADSEVANLANYLKCPVLSMDSDFFILSLEYGYINYSEFEWKHLCPLEKSQSSFGVPATVYHYRNFARMFCFDVTHFPLLSTCLGNDYIGVGLLGVFYSRMKYYDNGSNSGHGRAGQIRNVIAWLQNFSHIDEAVRAMLKFYKPDSRVEMEKTIRYSLSKYTLNTESNLIDFVRNGVEAVQTILPDFKDAKTFPSWFVRKFRVMKISVNPVASICLREVIDKIPMQNLHLSSAGNIAIDIKKTIYAIVNKDSFLKEKKNKKFIRVVRELSRKSMNLKYVQVTLNRKNDFDKVPSLSEIGDLELIRRQSLMLGVLSVNAAELSSCPYTLKLILASVIFTLNNSQIEITQALILILILIMVQYQNRGFALEVDPEVQPSLLRAQRSNGPDYDLNFVHLMAEWQCCLFHLRTLNEILEGPSSGHPFPNVVFSELCDFSHIYKVYIQIRDHGKPQKRAELLLKHFPEGLQLFEHINHLLKNTIVKNIL